MAAPGSTVWGSIANSKGKIGLYISTSSTNATTTVTVQVWVWTRYACYDSSNTLYFSDNATSATTDRGSVDFSHTVNSSWSTSNQTKIYTYTKSYARAAAAKTVYCAAKLTGIGWVDATMSVSASYTIPALASYTVSYNANGGSGAPSSQTKYYGVDLTLSSTKPTRTGYSFLGWGTSSTATSAAYAAGASYTSNAAITLYAVWEANTYTISYDANGGSGAPASQTKTYGTALTLSGTTPTRTNYNFLGWGIAASATAVSYAAGASYTTEASATLYAVWELAYSEPTINDFTVTRCASDGAADDFGTYIKAVFSWTCDQTQGANAVSEITIRYKTISANTWTSVTVSASGTSGSVSQIIGEGVISADSVYSVAASVADSLGETTILTRTVAAATFPIDFLSGGRGVAFGKPASKENAVEIDWNAYFNKDIYDKWGQPIANGMCEYDNGNLYIDPNETLSEEIVTAHANAPMGQGTLYYIKTTFYQEKSTTAYRAQVGVPCSENGSMYHRYYAGGAWSAWRRHKNADERIGTLWSGKWSSGDITIDTVGDYDLFLIDVQGIGTRILAVKEGTNLRGGNHYTNATQNTYFVDFAATISGTTLTYVYANQRRWTSANAFSVTDENVAVLKILGVM